MPRILLVRHPRDVTLSGIVAHAGVVGPGLILRAYIDFHRRLLPSISEIPVCRFEELIADPSVVVSRLNAAFATDFESVLLSAADRAALRTEMKTWEVKLMEVKIKEKTMGMSSLKKKMT